jgi:hypothetical protein
VVAGGGAGSHLMRLFEIPTSTFITPLDQVLTPITRLLISSLTSATALLPLSPLLPTPLRASGRLFHRGRWRGCAGTRDV